MTVKQELMSLTGLILANEKPFVIAESNDAKYRVLWSDSKAFSPGLAIDASVEAVEQLAETFATTLIQLELLNGPDKACLTISPDTPDVVYENEFGNMFLEAFRKYRDLSNGLSPIGLAKPVIERPQLVVVSHQ